MSGTDFASLPWPTEQALLGAGQPRSFRRGEVVFHQSDPGDTLYLLRSGRVAVRTVTELGDEVTVALLSAPDEFGEMALLRPGRHHGATVVALSPVRVVAVDADRFHALRHAHPELTEWLLAAVVRRLERSTELLADAYYLDAGERVARRLLDCVPACENRDAPSIPVSQLDIATIAGVSRPTADRVLRRLEGAGIVDLHRGRVDILDLAALQPFG